MRSAAMYGAVMRSAAMHSAAMRSPASKARVSMGDRVGTLAVALLLAMALAGCGNGPVLVFPGGAISGELKPDPSMTVWMRS